MLQVARLAPEVLGSDAAGLVREFLLSEIDASGGFRDRAGKPDLYYSVFGIEGLVAVRADPPADRLRPYLDGFGSGAGLDLVHLASLARCLAALKEPPEGERRGALLDRAATFRSPEGGYGSAPGAAGTAYGCFLALGLYQDLGAEIQDAAETAAFLRSLEAPGGGYANDRRAGTAMTPATAAASAVLRALGESPGPGTAAWLEARFHPKGGFAAAPGAPVPDLLSTAVALHALALLERPIGRFREACLDFVDTLWTNRGGFYGTWADDRLDCEYTYYALLALGHLSL